MANKKINQLVSKTAILSTDIFGIGDATTGQLFKKTIAELQAAIGGAVISVNGLVGTVVLDTDDIQELATPTNKYFTDARARGAISLTVTGNSGASTYSSGTGVLNVPTYTLAGLGGISATFLSGTSGISYNSTTGVISYSGTVYTDASIRALLSGSTGISYNSTTGAISYSGTVYTDASVRALISITTTGTNGASTYNNTTGVINVPNYTLAGLGGISLTSLSGGTGISYNSSTGAISSTITQYTDALARSSVSLTTTGTSGASTYNSTTGVFNIPQYQAVLTNPVTGTGTSGHVTYWNGSGTIAGSANHFWDNTNGRLGIGTASPSDKLNIVVSANGNIARFDGPTSGIILQTNATTTDIISYGGSTPAYRALNFSTGASTNLSIATTGAATFSSSVTANGGFYLPAISFGTSPNFAYTNSITYGLNSTGGNTGVYFGNQYNSSLATAIQLRVVDDGGTNITAMTITSAGNVGIGITTANPGATLEVRGTDATFRLGNTGGGYVQLSDNQISAKTSANAASDLYINVSGAKTILNRDSGNILLGTTSDNGEKLYVSGAIRATGTITANSDLTLKKNLLKIENALEKVEQINGYTYEFKADDSKRHGGVIAQEIDKVFPEIVNKGNDGILGVEYGNISALLIEAIKEQNIKIKNLETLLASK
jgi:hypothetical protein